MIYISIYHHNSNCQECVQNFDLLLVLTLKSIVFIYRQLMRRPAVTKHSEFGWDPGPSQQTAACTARHVLDGAYFQR